MRTEHAVLLVPDLSCRREGRNPPTGCRQGGSILNWFRARGELSNAIVEGFNGKARVTTKKAFGYRTCEVLEVALYHTFSDLPEPELTHRFC